MLNIRPPDRPARNWQDFFVQIATIAIGLLIAIGLETLAEAVHWHYQIKSTERALSSEVSDSNGQSYEREIVSDCVDRRLDELAVVIEQADRTGQLPAVGEFSMPPGRTWETGVWQSTISGQSGEHLPPERRNRYSSIYSFVTLLATDNAEEIELWTELHAMVGPGRTIEPSELAGLRALVSKARMVNQLMGLGAVRLRQLVENFITLDSAVEQPYRAAGTNDFAICRPIGPVPDHYGSAPIAHAIERARAHDITKITPGGVAGGAEAVRK